MPNKMKLFKDYSVWNLYHYFSEIFNKQNEKVKAFASECIFHMTISNGFSDAHI